MSLEQVAKTTKIQQRILERLEAGRFDGLPAEVFVRGFVRSFARCVGLDEDEALQRYAACGAGTGAAELTPTVRALVEAMVDLAPGQARQPRKLTADAAQPAAMEVIDFAASSGQMRAQGGGGGGGEIVELMMLPETGTVVVPMASMPMPMPSRRQTMEMAAVVPPPELLAEAFPAEAAVPVVDRGLAAAPEPEAAPEIDSLNPPVEISTASVDGEAKGKKKRGRRGGKGRNKKDAVPRLATGTPSEPTPVVAAPVELAPEAAVEADAPGGVEAISPVIEADAPGVVEAIPPVVEADAPGVVEAIAPSIWDAPAMVKISPVVEAAPVIVADEPATATWSPKMPPLATASSSVPWRRPAYKPTVTAKIPSLVIDDADPDSAERVLEARDEKHAPRRSFLPPILLDREDRSGRQGGLTLAVIILLIAATLTLSYLMRRPSAGGDGMTERETPTRTSANTFVG